jgi:hypothetical protein
LPGIVFIATEQCVCDAWIAEAALTGTDGEQRAVGFHSRTCSSRAFQMTAGAIIAHAALESKRSRRG